MRFRSRFKRAFLNFLRELTATPALSRYYAVPLPGPETEPTTVFDNKLLAEKNVLITGVGPNIGKHIALEIAKQGANIYFTDINQDNLSQLERELSQYPVKSKGFKSNVAIPDDIDLLCNSLANDGISIDILVNNVGIQFEKPSLQDFEVVEWHKVFDTNVIGPMHLTKTITQTMIDNNITGTIIFITSLCQWSVRRDPAYSAAKGALGMIIKELAVDLAPFEIRVNGIAPGHVYKNPNDQLISSRYVPLYNSTIHPRYIGRAAVYLASDYFSKYTTGTVLKIDAGLSLYNSHVDKTPPQR